MENQILERGVKRKVSNKIVWQQIKNEWKSNTRMGFISLFWSKEIERYD
jgi:hypothetical protein